MIESGAISSEERPLHALNRLGFGPRPGDLETIRRIGVDHWIARQLEPDSIPESAALEHQLESYETLRMTPVELFQQYGPPIKAMGKPDPEAVKAARKAARVIVGRAIQARLDRAVQSQRSLNEVMTAFWFNHFNIFAGKGLCYLWTGAYEEEAIRPHVLGRFRDLLGATARHPAMLFYLDNWQNTAPGSPGSRGKFEGINENYARELMELHTLGVNGGYSQQDVIALAHILTGWGIVRRNALRGTGFRARRKMLREASFTHEGFMFDPSRHDFSDKTLLRHHIRGGGMQEGEQALDLLASHPATAKHLSYQLAQYFVADNPPAGLVERMADRYLATDGNLREVMRTMIDSAQFWDRANYANKFKTPYEFTIAAVRATGAPVRNVRPLVGVMARLGMPLYLCQTPDGYKNTREAWLNPDAMMIRTSFATGLGAGRMRLNRPMSDFDDDKGERMLMRPARPAALTPDDDGAADPPDPTRLAMTLGGQFSRQTATAIEAAPERLRAALILGSPEFMMR